jgi:hypothetical protein
MSDTWKPFSGIGTPQLEAQGATQFNPQGIDWGNLVNSVVRAAVPVVISALQAQPKLNTQGFNFGLNTPLGGIGFGVSGAQPQLNPQGIDWASVAKTILPVVISALQANPQFNPKAFNFGVNTPVGGINFGVSGAQPQLSTQGIDLPGIISEAVKMAVPVVLSTLQAQPQVRPQGVDVGAIVGQLVPPLISGILGALQARPQFQSSQAGS